MNRASYYDVIFPPARCSTPVGGTMAYFAEIDAISTPTTIAFGDISATPTILHNTVNPVTGGTHVVQRGEILFRIGLRYRLPYMDIAALNGITNPTRIFAGQVLIIPGSNSPSITTTTTVTSTTESSGTGVNTTVNTTAPASGTTYTVRAGDNLFRIALRFGVSLEAPAAANDIINPRRIYVGQVLVIPQ